jgi:hypothetical protein
MIDPSTQFIVYNPNVNLTERKSALNNNIQEVVTVGDLRGYKVYTALLSQATNGTVTILSELENTIGEVVFQGVNIGIIHIGLVDITLEADKMIGFCYSGDDDNASYYPWIVNNAQSEIILSAGVPLIRDQICIRVDIRVYN